MRPKNPINNTGQTRRNLLKLAGLSLVGYAIWKTGLRHQIWPSSDLSFSTIQGLQGYRVFRAGAITLGGVPLFGLDNEKPAPLILAEHQLEVDICSALFGDAANNGTVAIAYFYDYQCPICRRLTPRLRKLKNVSLSWHDLAGLGPASETAARAAIAARKQGAFDQFHDRLMRAAFQPNEAYIRSLGDSLGINSDQLIADMNSPQVGLIFWQSRALASKFGMIGTPGMVIGHTVVIGNVSAGNLAAIIDDEAAHPTPCS